MLLQLRNRQIEIQRAKLKHWFQLEAIRGKIGEAADKGDTSQVSELVCEYLSVASHEPRETFLDVDWIETATAYVETVQFNQPNIPFPLFTAKEQQEKKEPWDYQERNWYLWLHQLAKFYGWSIEYISELELEDGIALLQEILTETQLEKEWQWQMSEIAYPYDPGSKTSKFKALDRPEWMRPKANVIKKVKMKSSMLPVGNIVDLAGVGIHGTTIH